MSNKIDWSKRVSQRVSLELEKVAVAREAERIAAEDSRAIAEAAEGRESKDFVRNCERRISQALHEEALASLARKEERLIGGESFQ